jgi:hypothetical protein
MSGHFDAEILAAFREDLLPARKAARIGAHLSSCPQCAEIDAQLASVTTILARSPVPPMPAALAARLDAALAAEAAARAAAGLRDDSAREPVPVPATAATPGPVPDSGPVPVPGPSGRRAHRAQHPRRRWTQPSPLALRLVAATAAVALIGGGGYAITRLASGAGSGVSAGSAGAAARSAAAPAAHPPLPGQGPESISGPAVASGGLRVVSSGTNYRPGTLQAQVSAVLRRYRSAGTAGQPGTPAHAGPSQAFPRLPVCVRQVSGGRRPLLVDVARYEGRAAAVIAVPVTGSRLVRVWLVGTGCAGQPGDVIARFTLPGTG